MDHLTVTALFDSLLASGGWITTTPDISGTARHMTMKFLPDVKYRRHEIKKIDIDGSSKYKSAQIAYFLEMHLLDMQASQHFAGLSTLTSEIILEIFRSIS